MKDDYITLDEEIIRLYLQSYSSLLVGKDYELGVAVFLNNFLERQYGCKCKIGFKLNQKYRHLYKNRKESWTLEQLRDLFEKHTKEDDLIDFSVSPTVPVQNKANGAWGFQLKRFGNHQREKGTLGLTDLLDKIGKKYTESVATLVIYFDGHISFDSTQIVSSIGPKYPFKRIMSVGYAINKTGKQIIRIGELWPNYGYSEYDIEDLLKLKPSEF